MLCEQFTVGSVVCAGLPGSAVTLLKVVPTPLAWDTSYLAREAYL